MKALFIFISLILSVIETSLLPLPLLLLFVLFISLVRLDDLPFFAAFFGGLFLDLFSAAPLGKSSLFLLLLVLFITLYRRKFQAGSALFIFAATAISAFLYLLLVQDVAFDWTMLRPLSVVIIPAVVLWIILQRKGGTYEVGS